MESLLDVVLANTREEQVPCQPALMLLRQSVSTANRNTDVKRMHTDWRSIPLQTSSGLQPEVTPEQHRVCSRCAAGTSLTTQLQAGSKRSDWSMES